MRLSTVLVFMILFLSLLTVALISSFFGEKVTSNELSYNITSNGVTTSYYYNEKVIEEGDRKELFLTHEKKVILK